MRRVLIMLTATAALFATPGAAASAGQPAGPAASCVALITSYEASQLAPGSVGHEVSGLAGPGLGTGLVSPLAREHLGSIAACRAAEG